MFQKLTDLILSMLMDTTGYLILSPFLSLKLLLLLQLFSIIMMRLGGSVVFLFVCLFEEFYCAVLVQSGSQHHG